MTDSNPKFNAEGWEIVPKSPHKIKTPTLIPIPAGKFLMGTSEEDIMLLQMKESDWAYDWSDNELFTAEQPQHQVTLPAFEIAQFPVTNSEYYIFIWDRGHRIPRTWPGYSFQEGTDDHPVVGISKIDAGEYIKWLNEKTGITYRLPTEAEWEYSARGEDGRIFPWGNTFDPWRCNTAESMKKVTSPVGSYSPSGDSVFGVADMVGNVWEWTQSLFMPYPYKPNTNREEIKPNGRYVVRGGAWYYSRKLARCAVREGVLQDHLSPSIGFRLARTLT
ncbi:MAG: SUMF1/EgtB/PvdO family nonheme iron enzyme [Anaerolineales bacterium]|uniref:formylglycine-generating enzyme family protein n=1 Tax=Candidatus Villigracilis vicinus TaxID=3140679 RepID=UPI003136E7EB|nr:SUMF1/EgtB/PvdO family nonheme iron enzyme [Anaerolineales bacterium]